jgi:hypothetical protein
MPKFVTIVVAPALEQVIEQPFFGKPHARLGRLFTVVGAWVYPQGGALGYGLRGHPALLGKLLGANPDEATEYVTEALADLVREYPPEAEGGEKDFFHIYVVRGLRDVGVDILAWPPSKKLDEKQDPQFVAEVATLAFHEGARFGYHLPELFRECWENTFRMPLAVGWQEAQRFGLELFETQKALPLEGAVAELAAGAIGWASEEAAGLLDDSELDVLKSLAASVGDIS